MTQEQEQQSIETRLDCIEYDNRCLMKTVDLLMETMTRYYKQLNTLQDVVTTLAGQVADVQEKVLDGGGELDEPIVFKPYGTPPIAPSEEEINAMAEYYGQV